MRKMILKSGLIWLWLSVAVLGIDQWTKTWVLQSLNFGEPLPIFPFFNLTLAYNTGAAFSFLHSASGWQNILLGGLALVVSIVILFWLRRITYQQLLLSFALCLLMGGAISNALDRIRYGYVIDFLDFHYLNWHFAIFNVADSAICLGTILLCWYWLRRT